MRKWCWLVSSPQKNGSYGRSPAPTSVIVQPECGPPLTSPSFDVEQRIALWVVPYVVVRPEAGEAALADVRPEDVHLQEHEPRVRLVEQHVVQPRAVLGP